MKRDRNRRERSRGQIVVVFALSLVALILAVGLVIDGGNAWSQRRVTQNAADFAALAGTKIVAANAGTPQMNAAVRSAVETALTSNGLSATNFGTDYTASYVNTAGNLVAGYGTAGNVPADVIGVQVTPSKTFSTYFLGVAGVTTFTASATASAKYGFYEGAIGGPGGNLVPIAVKLDVIAGLQNCPQGSAVGSGGPCNPVALTEGTHNAPGQFAWMSWDGTGNTPYLCSILGPPANSPVYTVSPNGYIVISGNTGVSNSSCVRNGIDAWVAMQATILVPIVSPGPPPSGQNCTTAPQYCYANGTPYPATSQGNGSNATYNVIGFAGFQLTGCSNPCVKNLQGVFRQAFFLGPTGGTTGTPSMPGGTLGIQLTR
jgi:Flp pilus assembly protein TadG